MSLKTYTPSCKVAETERKWHLIDAEDLVLGRLASAVANLLRGKTKPLFTPHNDCGDHVVIINAGKVHLTGNKREDKVYYHHTNYPGGLKTKTAKDILTGKFPERVLEKAVERMLPEGPLGRQVLKKLHIYAKAEHPHAAQNPVLLDFASRNAKNKKRS